MLDDSAAGFIERIAPGSGSGLADAARAARRYGFLASRDATRSGATAVLSSCPSLRNELRRGGATWLGPDGRWAAVDAQSFRLAQQSMDRLLFSKYAMGWGIALDGASPPPASLRYADAPPADFSQQDFWRWVQAFAGWDLAGTGNPLANSYGMAQGRQAARLGAARVPPYRAVRRGLPLSFTVQARLARMARRKRRGRAIRMPGPSWRPARRRPISSGRRRADGRGRAATCSAHGGRPGWLLPGLRRKPGGQAMRTCAFRLPRTTRAGLDRVRAVAVLADVVAAPRWAWGGRSCAPMQLGNSSRKAAAGTARRQAMSLHDVRNGVALRGARRLRLAADRREPVLRNDWLGEARLVQVRADTTVAMPPPFSGLRISRQVQVLSGAGHARDDADAQRRVGAASLSWRRVSQVSQERARAMGQLLETAESPGPARAVHGLARGMA